MKIGRATRGGLLPLVAVLLGFAADAQAQSDAMNDQAKASYQEGLTLARLAQLARGGVGDPRLYDGAAKSFKTAYEADPSVPVIWYSMGLALAHVPGDEMRAGALFKAYLRAVPNAPQAAALRQVSEQLSTKIEQEIDTLLEEARDQAKTYGAVSDANCPEQVGKVGVAILDAEAGRVADAETLLDWQPAYGQPCGYAAYNETDKIAAAFARGRHPEDSAPYIAEWEQSRVNGHPAGGLDSSLMDEGAVFLYEAIAIADVRNRNMDGALDADSRVMAALDAYKRDAPSGYEVWFQPAYARLIACVDTKRLDKAHDAEPFLSVHRNYAYSHDSHRDNANDELVRDAATYAALGFTGAEDVTAEALYDNGLRTAWTRYQVMPSVDDPSPDAVLKIDTALSDEDDLIGCLGNAYLEHRLLQIGTDGFSLQPCSVKDDDIAGCLKWVASLGGNNPEAKFEALRGITETMIRMHDTVFDDNWYDDAPG